MAQYRKDREITEESKRLGYANYTLAPGESLAICAYNNSHRILKHKIARHEIKCRMMYEKECQAQNKPVEIKVCRWNATHHIHISELEQHQLSCPSMAQMVDVMEYFQNAGKKEQADDLEGKQENKEVAEVMMETESLSDAGSGSTLTLSTGGDVMSDADLDEWEKEALLRPHVPYDPQKRLRAAAGTMIIQSTGLTKKERKKFRDEQAQIFEEKYGGDPAAMNRADKKSQEELSRASAIQVCNHNLRMRRQEEIAKAQRLAAISNDYHSAENRKLRKAKEDEHIAQVLRRAETSTLETSTLDTESSVSTSNMSSSVSVCSSMSILDRL